MERIRNIAEEHAQARTTFFAAADRRGFLIAAELCGESAVADTRRAPIFASIGGSNADRGLARVAYWVSRADDVANLAQLKFLTRTRLTQISQKGLALTFLPVRNWRTKPLCLPSPEPPRAAAMEGVPRALLQAANQSGDTVAPFFGFIGAASALVFACEFSSL